MSEFRNIQMQILSFKEDKPLKDVSIYSITQAPFTQAEENFEYPIAVINAHERLPANTKHLKGQPEIIHMVRYGNEKIQNSPHTNGQRAVYEK